MSIIRTKAGLSNLHLFHNVDAVVFVEGGEKTYSYEEVYAGKYGSKSNDILYWQNIFSVMASNIKVCFKPVGSKGTLKLIAHDIESGSIENVFVAMDRDIDNYDGSIIEHEGVFYSWGYSWENDLFIKAVLKSTILHLSPSDSSSIERDLEADLQSAKSMFIRSVRWFVRADIICLINGSGLFDRKTWKKYVKSKLGQNGEPFIDTSLIQVDYEITKKSITLRNRISGERISTIRNCFGHLIGTYCYRCLMHLLVKYDGIPSLSIEHANSFLSKILGELITDEECQELYRHHSAQFAFLN